MIRHTFSLLSAVLIVATTASTIDAAGSDADSQALAAVDRFMKEFNTADINAWAATLSYPHVRIASGAVKIWKTPAEYATSFDFDDFKRAIGWHHSALDYKKVVQSSENKVHVALGFTRYRADGSKIASYESIYVVTRVAGRWGIQARSSFAP